MAYYNDGHAWCFGCHLRIDTGNRSSGTIVQQNDVTVDNCAQLPSDCVNEFPEHVVDWIRKYDIRMEEALKWGWLYSPLHNQLIYPFYGQEKALLLYQARNFNPGKKKYYTAGSPQDLLPIFHSGKQLSTVVVVEDVISAAKIARQSDAMPCLGSHLPARKIMRLRGFYEALIVWLDADKYSEARHIAELGKWVGFKTKVIYTEKDPKEYSDKEILDNLS